VHPAENALASGHGRAQPMIPCGDFMKIHKVCYIQLIENPMIHIMTDELDIGKYYYFNLRTGRWNFDEIPPDLIGKAEQFLGVATFEELIAFRGQKLSPEAETARDELTEYIRSFDSGGTGGPPNGSGGNGNM
jgi:hypothetical protein